MPIDFKQVKTIKIRDRETWAEVNVPELGGDGIAIVRPMTVRDKAILASHSTTLGGLAENSAMCVIAALATIDERGQLVFGTTRKNAIEMVSNLPPRYGEAIGRLARKIMEISGFEMDAGARPTMAVDGIDEKTAVNLAGIGIHHLAHLAETDADDLVLIFGDDATGWPAAAAQIIEDAANDDGAGAETRMVENAAKN